MSDEENIDNTEFLNAAREGELETVKNLLEMGVDVNFADSEGCTALHYAAAERGSVEVVQELLKKKEIDVSIENKDNEMPLDIARANNKQEIIDVLVERIIDDSLEVLKTSSNNVKTGEASTDKTVKKIKQTIEKMKTCSKLLNKINDDIEETNAKPTALTYELANAFVNFLETFALNISSAHNKSLEEYFNRYYTNNDMLLFTELRNLLLHGYRSIQLKPEDVTEFIRVELTIEDFFKSLATYVQGVTDRIDLDNKGCGNLEDQTFLKSLKDIEEKREPKIKESSFIKEELKELVTMACTEQKMTHKLVFHFVINFCPVLKNKTDVKIPKLNELRNNLIHEFHKYGLNEFRKYISEMAHTLFKYYYALEVHEVLKPLDITKSDSQEINKKITDKLESLENSMIEEKKFVVPEDEAEKFIGYKFLRSKYPQKNDDLEILVGQYLSWMSIIDETENEGYVRKQPPKQLNASRRRKIFEEFENFKQKYANIGGDINEEKESEKASLKVEADNFRDELFKEYGVNKDYFGKMFRWYIEGTHQVCDNSVIKIISNTMKILKGIRDDYKLSTVDVIALYDRFLRKKDSFSTNKSEDLLPNQNKSTKECIDKKIRQLPQDAEISIKIGAGLQLSLSHAKVISNMLKTFNKQNTYKMKFNIKDVFADEEFSDDLVQKIIEPSKIDKAYIKKLLEVGEYTAPYIVGLIKRVNSHKMIEPVDLNTLVTNLLMTDRDLYIKHLKKLLNIENKKLNHCNIVYDKIRQNFDVSYTQPIFEEYRHVEGMLEKLIKTFNKNKNSRDKTVELIIKILKIITYKVLEFIPKDKYNEALEKLKYELRVINIIKSTSGELGELDEVEFDIKLKIAKVCNSQAKIIKEKKIKNRNIANENIDNKKIIREEVSQKCNQAVEILEHKPKTKKMTHRHLLALYHEACAHRLMNKRESAESVDKYESLCIEIVKYVGLSNESIPPYTNETYIIIVKSSEDLKATSVACKKYLDILYIREAMAWAYTKRSLVDSTNAVKYLKKALKIYKEVYLYKYKNEDLGSKHKSTIKSLRYIASVHTLYGENMLKSTKYADALKYQEDALLSNLKLFKIQNELYGNYHLAVGKNIEYITKSLSRIESLCLGENWPNKEEREKLVSRAQKISGNKYFSLSRDKFMRQ